MFSTSVLFVAFISYDLCRQDVANHLLECLKDDEVGISDQASNLVPMIG